MRPPLTAGLMLSALFLLVAAEAGAVTFWSGPYAFSDELGGFRLKSVSGTGTAEDPIVLVEEFVGIGPAILTVHRLPFEPHFTPSLGENFPSFINLEKIVINSSRRPWVGFDLELEEIRGEPSTYRDGLSFDQISRQTGRVGSDRFARGERTFEPGDRLLFFGGGVDPDDAVRFTLLITDTSPNGTFYLIQRPQFATAGMPTKTLPTKAAHPGERNIEPAVPFYVKAGLGATQPRLAACHYGSGWSCPR